MSVAFLVIASFRPAVRSNQRIVADIIVETDLTGGGNIQSLYAV